MSEDRAVQPAANEAETPATTARRLVRTAWTVTLATLDASTGHPYGSLAAVACEPDGTPLLLLSDLALHTKNLVADARASLLFDGTGAGPSALTGARVTVAGRLEPLTDPELTAVARRRYLARHPSAAMFVDFADFRFYRLVADWAHLVAGFGRIQRLRGDELIRSTADCPALVAAECDIVQHMNDDHADTLGLMAVALAAASTPAPVPDARGPWRMLGCDPCGIDLAADDRSIRLDFLHRVKTAEAARLALSELVHAARRTFKP